MGLTAVPLIERATLSAHVSGYRNHPAHRGHQTLVGLFVSRWFGNWSVSRLMSALANPVGSLDAAYRIPARCEALDITTSFLAAYVGWSKGELSKRLNLGLTGPETQTLYHALDDLTWMTDQFYPLRPRMKPEDAWRVKNFIKTAKEFKETAALVRALSALRQNIQRDYPEGT